MAYQSNNLQSPCAEYLYKIQMIVSNSTFKNKELASKYETLDIKFAGDKYVDAVMETDTFESYTYNDKDIYQALLDFGYPEDRIYLCIENPNIIPSPVRRELMLKARKDYKDSYVEMNKYYCNLWGKPFIGNESFQPDPIITIPDGFFYSYSDTVAITQNEPIYMMEDECQDLLINSPYYQQLLDKFPNVEYLKYIGSNKIPIEVSRTAKDGAILKINTNKLSGYHRKFGNVSVSPDIVHLYVNIYNQVRDYVYNTLRGNFSSIYPNYNNIIRFLTIYMSIGQSVNELMKKSSSMSYLNNTSANNYFMLYGLPSVIMEGQSMINFLKKFRLLLMDKGTNVVYRVKDYIGYKYTDIFSLIMVKQQVFENGKPKYVYDSEGNSSPVYKIVFRRMGTTADKTSYFRFREETTEYDWKEIASGDPRWWWWNDPDIDSMLYEMNYTLSNSKYIQLSTHMSLSDIYWQTVILLRGLLDKKSSTKNVQLAINYDLGGLTDISVFDAVVCLLITMNWNMTMVNGKSFNGEFYKTTTYNGQAVCIDMLFNMLKDDGLTPEELTPGKPFKLSSFNFNIKNTNPDFYMDELPTYDYLNPSVFIPMLDVILNNQTKNVGEVLMNDTRRLYDYLEDKLLKTKTIHEFRQVTETFKNLFLINPADIKWNDNMNYESLSLIADKYHVPETDLYALQRFCMSNEDEPKFIVNYDAEAYTIDLGFIMNQNVKTYVIEKDEKEYYPFLDTNFVLAYNNALDKYISTSIQLSTLSESIKNNYQNIFKDKVTFDLGVNTTGPNSFEGLLMLNNPDLYTRLIDMKNHGDKLILFMRSIVKALETYASSELSALEYSAIGENEYMNILKEVISYFKSYMVEFTKDEFMYVMDGLFDNGGNSNMLRLYDEIVDLTVDKHIPDSITLYDVSNNTLHQQWKDYNSQVMYDDAIIRAVGKYSYIKSLGYDILFDDGNKITKNEPTGITDDSDVTGTMVTTGNTYTIIIPTSMIN